ncbi:ParB/RepB/Spo0J family partition protein [Candidatus Dojkabacteria bacterium]|nr:ParB/RepB/Spo0J family partition protein [Candidatus Dojkabacteria bacterium]
MAKGEVLGKGLSALISDDSIVNNDHSYIPNLSIDQIKPNPYQPRMEIKPETLLELADSIREHGIIEPLIVTQKDTDEYELVAGERRWRAAKLAGVKSVPAVIKEASPQQMLEMAIVENIQRADLSPLEEALAFKQLVDNHKLTHTDIAKKVGLSRPAVANKIRLLNLPEEVKKGLLEKKISEGHSRALLGLASSQSITSAYRKIVKENLSVRAVEELVRRLNEGRKTTPTKKEKNVVDKKIVSYEKGLQDLYGKGLKIFRSKRGGKIIIPFTTDIELEKQYKKLLRK